MRLFAWYHRLLPSRSLRVRSAWESQEKHHLQLKHDFRTNEKCHGKKIHHDMNTKPHQTIATGVASLLFLSVSANGATVLATLNSQDRIIGARQSGGDPLGYYPESQLTVGVAGGDPKRVNTNTVIGFTLPTLNLGESLSAASFAITIASSSGTNFTVGLFGLATENPDASEATLFSQSGDGAINASFTSSGASVGSSPFSDVTSFLQSLYTGDTPIQTEVFFRLNQTSSLNISATRRVNFTKETATLTLTTIPEPSAALLGGLGTLIMLRRRRNV